MGVFVTTPIGTPLVRALYCSVSDPPVLLACARGGRDYNFGQTSDDSDPCRFGRDFSFPAEARPVGAFAPLDLRLGDRKSVV